MFVTYLNNFITYEHLSNIVKNLSHIVGYHWLYYRILFVLYDPYDKYYHDRMKHSLMFL